MLTGQTSHTSCFPTTVDAKQIIRQAPSNKDLSKTRSCDSDAARSPPVTLHKVRHSEGLRFPN